MWRAARPPAPKHFAQSLANMVADRQITHRSGQQHLDISALDSLIDSGRPDMVGKAGHRTAARSAIFHRIKSGSWPPFGPAGV
jgi:hypothetical protein